TSMMKNYLKLVNYFSPKCRKLLDGFGGIPKMIDRSFSTSCLAWHGEHFKTEVPSPCSMIRKTLRCTFRNRNLNIFCSNVLHVDISLSCGTSTMRRGLHSPPVMIGSSHSSETFS